MPTIASPPHAAVYDRRDASRLAVRLRVALQRAALTQSLSEGADASSSPELALRAQQLVDARERRILARTLERTLDEAGEPRLSLYGPTPVRRREVLNAEKPLRILIERLRDDRPVAAEGMALIERLITDGCWSPLYNLTVPGSLRRLAVLATAALDPGI